MTQMPVLKEDKRVRIGDYVVTGKVGQGGIAEVYRGLQESLNRDVAIKVLNTNLTSDEDIVRRFERESLVIARLSHPNIVHVIDKGKAGGCYFFVMEYVDGTSLREVIDSPKVPMSVKLDMIVQVCKALDYAHKNGVIHRDIKPTNILIDKQGNARVADFGIAQIVGTPDSEMTSTDVVMGTQAYMSPEQKISSTNVDQTTDIWAMGIMIYEILTARKPQGAFKLPTELNPNLPKAFDKIVQTCLAQEPKDRFQSAVMLKDALLEALGSGRNGAVADDVSLDGADSFLGKCRYLDTIKETKYSATVLVENTVNKKLYIIKKHGKGEAGRKEAKLLAKLKHAHIVGIFGSGGDARSTVVITEYAPGGSLADRMVRRWEWQRAMPLLLQIAAGLDFAHKNGIVHGNLRPSNILFDASENAKITDFGMPAHYDTANKKNWYAPPEHKPSRMGDIYAIGVILHQLITGRLPEYDLQDNLNLEDVHRALPADIENIMRKLLAIRVINRYSTFEEVQLDWQLYQQRVAEDEARRLATPEAPTVVRAPIPIWAWFAAAGILALTVVLTLLFSGALGR